MWFYHRVPRRPLVQYRSPECWGYAELEQTWKHMSTQCCISCHPCRSIRKQIWPCHKNGQGQPRFIIWKNGGSQVPDAVYQVSRSSASWFRKRRFFLSFFLPYGHCHVTRKIWTNFQFSTSHGDSIWNLASIGPAVSEEKRFENVESEWSWTTVNEWPWVVINCHVFIYLTICTNFQSLNRLPVWNSQNCSMFPLAFDAGWLQGHWWGFISRNYVVWPTFLLMNVFIALKGSHFWFLFHLIEFISF